METILWFLAAGVSGIGITWLVCWMDERFGP